MGELARRRPDNRGAEILNQRGVKTLQGLPGSYRLVKDVRRHLHRITVCPIVSYDERFGECRLGVTGGPESPDNEPGLLPGCCLSRLGAQH